MRKRTKGEERRALKAYVKILCKVLTDSSKNKRITKKEQETYRLCQICNTFLYPNELNICAVCKFIQENYK